METGKLRSFTDASKRVRERNTRDETRTRIALACWGILSPLCLPIPPPGQILLLQQLTELCDHNKNCTIPAREH